MYVKFFLWLGKMPSLNWRVLFQGTYFSYRMCSKTSNLYLAQTPGLWGIYFKKWVCWRTPPTSWGFLLWNSTTSNYLTFCLSNKEERIRWWISERMGRGSKSQDLRGARVYAVPCAAGLGANTPSSNRNEYFRSSISQQWRHLHCWEGFGLKDNLWTFYTVPSVSWLSFFLYFWC